MAQKAHRTAGFDPIACILPPHILRAIVERGTPQQRSWALQALAVSERIRGRRELLGDIATASAIAGAGKQRTVYDAKKGTRLPGAPVRSEGDPPTNDAAVNEAYDGAGATYDLYRDVYGRDSVDDRGMPLVSSIHYRVGYDNAFWDGSQMVYGDGDGKIFQRFTKAVDVIGHELTHGVTQYEAGLEYADQPGALNESFSDVFGSLVKQRSLGQSAGQADWLIGAGLFTAAVKGKALRSMAAPGTAYDDPLIGKDPQPADMAHYVQTADDNGGVHINSGIPNRGFYLAATAIGGNAWEKAGKVWYVTLRDRLRPKSDFKAAAMLTVTVAKELFGARSVVAQAVNDAWAQVGVFLGSAMRVKLERSGGLANVHRSVSVDAAALAPERAEELRRLVAAANLSKFPDNPTPIAGRPDRFIYKLTVEDESAAHTVTVSEDVATEDLQRLVDWLQHTAEG